MLSSIGRAAIQRLVSTPTTTTSSRRFLVSRLVAYAPKYNFSSVQSFAAPARPKTSATTGRATKRTATKTPTKKSTTKSKTTKSKTKAAPVKAESKPVRKRKPLTPEKQALLERKELKKTALFTEPKLLASTPWTVFVIEQTKQKAGGPADLRSRMEQISQSFRALPASELQRLANAGEQNKLSNAAAYKAWVESHTPEQINKAISARIALKKKFNVPKGTLKTIRDERIPKRPMNPYSLFTKARWASGDYASKTVPEGSKGISKEWKSLPDTERHAYVDLAKSSLDQYEKDVKSVLHRAVHRRPSPNL